MNIKVKECCHSPNRAVRYDAVVGDVLLIRRSDGMYVEATIRAIPSSLSVIVAELWDTESIEKEVSISEVAALMLGD